MMNVDTLPNDSSAKALLSAITFSGLILSNIATRFASNTRPLLRDIVGVLHSSLALHYDQFDMGGYLTMECLS
uniref:Uncharacterized protein n=1 Tax=Glossina palpalis gambiensis TaxID=67801 RepID=A0A1B0BT24_9MUSC